MTSISASRYVLPRPFRPLKTTRPFRRRMAHFREQWRTSTTSVMSLERAFLVAKPSRFLRSQFNCWVRMYSFTEGMLMVFMPLLYSVVSYEQRASLKATFLRFSVSFIMTNCAHHVSASSPLKTAPIYDILLCYSLGKGRKNAVTWKYMT